MTEFSFRSVEGDFEIGSCGLCTVPHILLGLGEMDRTCSIHKSMIMSSIREVPGLNLDR
jgi:hypothetical protein